MQYKEKSDNLYGYKISTSNTHNIDTDNEQRIAYLKDRYNIDLHPDPLEKNTSEKVNQNKKTIELERKSLTKFNRRRTYKNIKKKSNTPKQNKIKKFAKNKIGFFFILLLTGLLFKVQIFFAILATIVFGGLELGESFLGAFARFFSNVTGLYNLFFVLLLTSLVIGIVIIVIVTVILIGIGSKPFSGGNQGTKVMLLCISITFLLFPVTNIIAIMPILLWMMYVMWK